MSVPSEEAAARGAAPPGPPERSSASLLVRCWLEPAAPGQTPTLRGYVKNLKTGEELFIKDLDAVGEQLRQQLAAAEIDLQQNAPLAAHARGRQNP